MRQMPIFAMILSMQTIRKTILTTSNAQIQTKNPMNRQLNVLFVKKLKNLVRLCGKICEKIGDNIQNFMF